jgi:hypothetical protein
VVDRGPLISILQGFLEPVVKGYSKTISGVSNISLKVYEENRIQKNNAVKSYINVEFNVLIHGYFLDYFHSYNPEHHLRIFSKELAYWHLQENMEILKKWVEMPFGQIPLHLPLKHWKEDREIKPFIHRLVKARLRDGF